MAKANNGVITAAYVAGVSPDDGASSSDFVTNTTTLSLRGTVTMSAKGNQPLYVWVSKDGSMADAQEVGFADVTKTGNWSVGLQGLTNGTYTVFLSTSQTAIVQPFTTTPQAFTIDTTPPELLSVSNSMNSGNDVKGTPVTLTLKFDSTVNVTSNTKLTLSDGSVASYTGGSGTDQITFTYTAKKTASNVTISSVSKGSITDVAGNDATHVANQSIICFMAGTHIRTPDGETLVETLKAGDLVTTADGGSAPVRWVGRQTVNMHFADPLRVSPVRVGAGALSDSTPSRDLLVSPDHALLVDGVLVHAGALVNGVSIARDNAPPASFVYYHVELDDHALIFAEGVPAETFIDNVQRLAFDNWAEHEALYPEGKAIAEMAYPRAKSQRQIPRAIRERLLERALILNPQPEAA